MHLNELYQTMINKKYFMLLLKNRDVKKKIMNQKSESKIPNTANLLDI